MKTKARRKLKHGDRIHVGGEEYVLVPASEYPRHKGTRRKVVFDALDALNWLSGRDLRRDREAAGLTQTEVARRAGMRAETLSRLERGRGNPTVGTISRIVRAIRGARQGAGSKRRGALKDTAGR